MDSRAERAPFLRIFLRCDKFRELASQNSAFPSTATKNLCSAFELNKQPGWRMELNTTAVPLLIFVQQHTFIPEITKGTVNCESN